MPKRAKSVAGNRIMKKTNNDREFERVNQRLPFHLRLKEFSPAKEREIKLDILSQNHDFQSFIKKKQILAKEHKMFLDATSKGRLEIAKALDNMQEKKSEKKKSKKTIMSPGR